MNRLARTITRAALTMTLALVGLGFAATAPAAHAGGGSITTTGQGLGVYVQGTGFTDGLPVHVQVWSSSWWIRVVGSGTSAPPIGSGSFSLLVPTTGYTGNVTVVAWQDGGPSTFANSYTADHVLINLSGGWGSINVYSGSGFIPGATVRLHVSDVNDNPLPGAVDQYILVPQPFYGDNDPGVLTSPTILRPIPHGYWCVWADEVATLPGIPSLPGMEGTDRECTSVS